MTSLFSQVMVYGFENLKMFKGWKIEDFSGELCIFLGGTDVLKGLKCINGSFFSMRGRGLKLFFLRKEFFGPGHEVFTGKLRFYRSSCWFFSRTCHSFFMGGR